MKRRVEMGRVVYSPVIVETEFGVMTASVVAAIHVCSNAIIFMMHKVFMFVFVL